MSGQDQHENRAGGEDVVDQEDAAGGDVGGVDLGWLTKALDPAAADLAAPAPSGQAGLEG